jgi:hypothetical protein
MKVSGGQPTPTTNILNKGFSNCGFPRRIISHGRDQAFRSSQLEKVSNMQTV